MPTRGTTFPERRVNISSDLPCARAESLTLVNCVLVRRHGPGAVMLWYCAELRRESACAARRYMFPSWPRGWRAAPDQAFLTRHLQFMSSSTLMSFGLYSVHLLEQIYLWRFCCAIFVVRNDIYTVDPYIQVYNYLNWWTSWVKLVICPATYYKVWRSSASCSKSVLVLRSTA